jgi:hypothetical protein
MFGEFGYCLAHTADEKARDSVPSGYYSSAQSAPAKPNLVIPIQMLNM